MDGGWDCDSEHIVLIGMMGAGKSSVGRVLARRLGRPLLDSDEMIEAETGRTVREIWQAEGEPVFRDLEAGVLRRALTSSPPAVIAAAGGVVLGEENRRLLAGSDAHVVWLLAGVDVLLERVRNGAHRPLLDEDPERVLTEMFERRAPLYREVADAIVSVDHRTVLDVAQAVVRCCA